MHPYAISVFGNIHFELHKCTFPNLHSSVDVRYSFCNRVSVSLNFILFLKQYKLFSILYAFLCFL